MTLNPILIVFVLSAVLLTLLAIVAIVWPLWRPAKAHETSLLSLNVDVFKDRLQELEQDRAAGRVDDATFVALKTELERQLLIVAEQPETPATATVVTSRKPVLFLLVVVPTLVALIYGGMSWQPALGRWWQVEAKTGPLVDKLFAGESPTKEELEQHTLPDLVRVMQQRLQRHPNDANGWYMLGMGYLQGQIVPQALEAFQHAQQLAPERDDIALSYAQTLIFSQQGRLDSTSRALLTQVLSRQPEHEGALLLLGMGAYRSGDYQTALLYLPKLHELHIKRTGDAQSAAVKELEQVIRLAQQGGQQEPTANATASIEVSVRLDKALLAKVAPTDTLFIFARALNGPPMPLAVVRQSATALPITVELNDSQSMVEGMTLSRFPSVVIGARISKSGNPVAQAGDLEAVAVPLTQNGKQQHVDLVINQQK